MPSESRLREAILDFLKQLREQQAAAMPRGADRTAHRSCAANRIE
jgi:hypothetical protein